MQLKSLFFVVSSVSTLLVGCEFKDSLDLRATEVNIGKKFDLRGSAGETITVRPKVSEDEDIAVSIPGVKFNGPNDLCKDADGTKAFDALILQIDVALIIGPLFLAASSNSQVTLTAEDIKKLSKLPPCVVTDKGSWATRQRKILRMLTRVISPEKFTRAQFEGASLYVPNGSDKFAIALNFSQDGRAAVATFDTGIAKDAASSMAVTGKLQISSRASGQPVDLTIVRGIPKLELNSGSYTASCVARSTRVICIEPIGDFPRFGDRDGRRDGEQCRTEVVYEEGQQEVSYSSLSTNSPFDVTITTPAGAVLGNATLLYTESPEGSSSTRGTCVPTR